MAGQEGTALPVSEKAAGSRSELLPVFGIKPTRSKLRKTRPVEVLPPSALRVFALPAPAAGAVVSAVPEVPKEGASEGGEE